MQVQTQITQTQDLETQLINQIKEKILNDEYSEELAFKHLALILMGKIIDINGLDKLAKIMKEQGWDINDISVYKVYPHYFKLEIRVTLPNDYEQTLNIETESTRALSKEEYNKYLELIKNLKGEWEKRVKLKKLEREVERLQKIVKELEEGKDWYEKHCKKLSDMIEEFREFIIMKEIESEFIEWLTNKRHQESMEQLKEELKSEFFPNEYDDC